MTEMQEQFDWTKETAKCVEGLKFDLDQDYNFQIVFEDVALHVLKNKAGDILTYKKGDRQGQPLKMFLFPFRETETNVVFKLEYFQNDSYRVNPANPELEDEIVKFSRRLGYNPVLDGTFSPTDFIKPGIEFTARLTYQKPTEAGYTVDEKSGMILDAKGTSVKKAYKTIDISTIKIEGASAGGDHQDAIEKVSDAEQKEILEFAKGCKKFSELVTKFNKAKKSELLDAAMRLKEQGILKL